MSATTGGRTQQRFSALETANRRRMAAVQVKRHFKDLPFSEAWTEAAELLRSCPEGAGSLELHAFLEAVPGIGRERLRRICQSCHVWPFRRVRDLTVAERDRIAERVVHGGGWERL
jgi:hypothetical protein